ncbi:MAG: GNAT family N-acetyltransferase [Ignavibacteria bacterium]|nr:GNAT family N-acetyltransferase [Ignavibacteria bacterium]
MPQESSVLIRPMVPEEMHLVHEVMRRSLPFFQRWFFAISHDVLVAEQFGRILGAIVLKFIPLPERRRGGVLSSLFTDPDARGRGVGRMLVDGGIHFLEKRGVEEILTCIEGNDDRMSNLLSSRGFSLLSSGQQFRRYGFGAFPVWLRISHYIDIGRFVWVRPSPEGERRAVAQRWWSITINALLLLMALWSESGFTRMEPVVFLAIPLACGVFFLLREEVMRRAASLYDLPVEFRMWESGFPASLIVAAAFGFWLPVPGSVYPAHAGWRYRELIPRLGRMAFAGSLAILLLTWGVVLTLRLLPHDPAVEYWLDSARVVGEWLTLFDIALPFFPYVSFNGRRIWDWSKPLWVCMALAAMGLFFV